jgi:hypothetical protein
MPEEVRKLVSGWGGGTTGLFGSMRGAGNFKNIVREMVFIKLPFYSMFKFFFRLNRCAVAIFSN